MNLAGKRIVLVGGAGLVGSHIVDQLTCEQVKEIVIFDDFSRGTRANLKQSSQCDRVKIVEGSMSDRETLRRVIQGADGVFLLASLWLGECLNDPRRAWETNVMGSWNVIEACRDYKVERVVYSSSASVYGDAVVTPMTEEHPFNNRTTYGATKIAIEQMLRAMHAQHNLPYIGMRYMNIYGPRMDYRGAYVSVIMKVLDRIFAGERPAIFGDGSQVYDFIYVEDAARANVLGMKASCMDEYFNIGTGIGTTINDLVQELIRLSGVNVEPEHHPQMQSLVTHRIGAIEKAQAMLGFRASTDLSDGLQKVVEWRQSQQRVAP